MDNKEDLIELLRELAELSPQIISSDVRRKAIDWIEILSQYIDNRVLHITEQTYPEQTKRFREILDEMYATHLKKNADYSPYNILVTGMRGCVTRLWDKSARFFNLMGLDIGTYKWTEEKMNMVEDEDVNTTLIDWANYCIITRILREGHWGK